MQKRSLRVKKVFIKAANACGNKEGAIPGGNKKAKYRSFASFFAAIIAQLHSKR